jgi:hypothetical protein
VGAGGRVGEADVTLTGAEGAEEEGVEGELLGVAALSWGASIDAVNWSGECDGAFGVVVDGAVVEMSASGDCNRVRIYKLDEPADTISVSPIIVVFRCFIFVVYQ